MVWTDDTIDITIVDILLSNKSLAEAVDAMEAIDGIESIESNASQSQAIETRFHFLWYAIHYAIYN